MYALHYLINAYIYMQPNIINASLHPINQMPYCNIEVLMHYSFLHYI